MIAPVRKRASAVLLCAAFAISSSGCLGTSVDAPTPHGKAYATLQIHLLSTSASIRADACRNGLADVTTHVPLWGLAVGILTLGIVVPQWTIYSCVR